MPLDANEHALTGKAQEDPDDHPIAAVPRSQSGTSCKVSAPQKLEQLP